MEHIVSQWEVMYLLKAKLLLPGMFVADLGSVCSKKLYSAQLKIHMYHSKETISVRSCTTYHIVALGEFSFWWKYFLLIRFDKEALHFLPIRPLKHSWRTTCIMQRKSSILEVATSSTLFSLQNWVSFLKWYFLQLMFFKVEVSSCSKYSYLDEMKKHMYLSKENHLC
jgi:hypothetical protein